MKTTLITCIIAMAFVQHAVTGRIFPGPSGPTPDPGAPGSGDNDEHLYCRSENDCCWQGKDGSGIGACMRSDVAVVHCDSQGSHFCKNLGVTVQQCVGPPLNFSWCNPKLKLDFRMLIAVPSPPDGELDVHLIRWRTAICDGDLNKLGLKRWPSLFQPAVKGHLM